MTTMEKPQNLSNAATYTARNRDRSPDYGRAAKYLDPSATLERRLSESLRRADALRVANRISHEARRRSAGHPDEPGLSRIRFTLHGIRDAESVDALINRDRLLDGIIIGARLFGNMRQQDADALHALRMNAFDCRRRELIARYEAVLP